MGEIFGGRVAFVWDQRLNVNLALAGQGQVLREYRTAQRDYQVYTLEQGELELHYSKDRAVKYAVNAQQLLDVLMTLLEPQEAGLFEGTPVRSALELTPLGKVLLADLKTFLERLSP